MFIDAGANNLAFIREVARRGQEDAERQHIEHGRTVSAALPGKLRDGRATWLARCGARSARFSPDMHRPD
jgi:hypothetical protein